jgi:hypothetical protein
MPMPDSSAFCVEIDVATGLRVGLAQLSANIDLSALKIRLPGGIAISANAGSGIPNPADMANALMGQVNTALAPFEPIFNIIDVCTLVFKLLKAFGPPPNPIEIGKLIQKLVVAIDKLLAILPPLSIPLMIVDIIDTLTVFLVGLRAELAQAAEFHAKIHVAGLKIASLQGLAAQGNVSAGTIAAQLQASIDCASVNFDAMFQATKSNAKPINRILDMVNQFGALADLPSIDPFDVNAATDPTAMLVPIDALLAALKVVRTAIPV